MKIMQGKDLCVLLGLDPSRVRSIVITAVNQGPVKMDVELIPMVGDNGEFIPMSGDSILKKYVMGQTPSALV